METYEKVGAYTPEYALDISMRLARKKDGPPRLGGTVDGGTKTRPDVPAGRSYHAEVQSKVLIIHRGTMN